MKAPEITAAYRYVQIRQALRAGADRIRSTEMDDMIATGKPVLPAHSQWKLAQRMDDLAEEIVTPGSYAQNILKF
jgi:hypothetical protein